MRGVFGQAIEMVDARDVGLEFLTGRIQRGPARTRYMECPHCGKHPSYPFVVDGRGYQCFKCGEHGGILRLLEVAGGLETRIAKRWIIAKAGLVDMKIGPAGLVALQRHENHMKTAVVERDAVVAWVSGARALLASEIRHKWDLIETKKRDGSEDIVPQTVAEIAGDIAQLGKLEEALGERQGVLESISARESLAKYDLFRSSR